MFSRIEFEKEQEERDEYNTTYYGFLKKHGDNINITELDELLKAHALASSKGLLVSKRPRWDFTGAFYFVGTVVSTIGRFCMLYTAVFTSTTCTTLCALTAQSYSLTFILFALKRARGGRYFNCLHI